MAGIFRASEENTGARYEYRARISTVREVYRACPTKGPVDLSPFERPQGRARKRPPSRICVRALISKDKPQSFQLGSLRPGQRRARLTVPAPLRPALLAGTQITGAQTIPFDKDTL